MKLAAAPMIIDILTACCVNGQGRESRTLSNPQRSQLSEIVSLSYQRETMPDQEEEADPCISEIVDAADECFTRTAIPLVCFTQCMLQCLHALCKALPGLHHDDNESTLFRSFSGLISMLHVGSARSL